jgi:hypothetical protein
MFVACATNAESELAAIERCGAYSASLDEIVELTSLSVSTISADGAFSLPISAPKDATSVHCTRKSLLPLRNDYKVLLAGFPFVITSGERIAVLEVSEEGRVQFRAIRGEFTDQEIPAIREYLNYAQLLLNVPTQTPN